jgi:hypothetical protein
MPLPAVSIHRLLFIDKVIFTAAVWAFRVTGLFDRDIDLRM